MKKIKKILEKTLANLSFKLFPRKWEYYCDRSCAFYDLGKLDEAIASYDKAIIRHTALESKGSFECVYFYRGNAFYRLRKLDEAIADYDRAISLGFLGKNDSAAAYYLQALKYFQEKGQQDNYQRTMAALKCL